MNPPSGTTNPRCAPDAASVHDQKEAAMATNDGSITGLRVVSTRTYTRISFANPHLRCDQCAIWVPAMRSDTNANLPCGHLGVTSVCPSWGPVDGCTCTPRHQTVSDERTAQHLEPTMTVESGSASGPHGFRGIRWWDNHHRMGRCIHCYLPLYMHPVKGWATARPLDDDRRPTLLLEQKGSR